MESIFAGVAWLAAVSAVGWGMLSLIFRKKGGLYPAEKLALSYGIGLGAVTIEMTLLSVAGVRVAASHIAVLAALMLVPAFYFRGPGMVGRSPKARMLFSEKLFLAAIIFQVAYAFFRALIMPIEAYDAVAIYGMKAKIFYLAGGIPQDFFTHMKTFVNHIEYPLLIPLAEDSVYTFFGSFNDIASKAVFPLYYTAILTVFYFVAYRRAGRKASMLFTFLLATVPQFYDYASNGYADLPLGFYFSASLFYIFLWIKEKRGAYLALSFALSALGAWTKSEGIMLFGVNVSIALYCMFAYGPAMARQAALYAAASVISVAGYLKLIGSLGMDLNIDFKGMRPDIVTAVKRIPGILYEYQIQFFGPKKWNLTWVLFIAAFVAGFRKAFSGALKLPTFAILLALGAYTALYMITPLDFLYHVSKTASRLFLHFLPVVILWLAVYYDEKKLDI